MLESPGSELSFAFHDHLHPSRCRFRRLTPLSRMTARMVTSFANRQDQSVADLTSLQEEESDICHPTRGSCDKERTALSGSQRRVRELELEMRRLFSLLEAADSKSKHHAFPARGEVGVHGRQGLRKEMNDDGGARTRGGRGSKLATGGDNDADVCPYEGGGSIDRQERGRHRMMNIRGENEILTEFRSCENCGKDGAGRRDSRFFASAGIVRIREVTEQERTRKTVAALEDSCQAAREEAEHLKRLVRRLRVALREAQQRGDDVEASRVEAEAAASAAGTALIVVTTKANTAVASRHEVEQKALAAERQHRSKVETLQAELSRQTAEAIRAREQSTTAQGDISRLRERTRDYDRHVASLEKRVALLMGSLLDADAGRVRALLGRVRDLAGRGWEGDGRCTEDLAGHVSTNAAVNSTSARDEHTCVRTGVLSPWPLESSNSGSSSSSGGDLFEVTALRNRLTASHAQHMELVRESEEVVARCYQRCEARVRAALAAGKLVAACSHQHGFVSGREMALEAAGRLALVKRCFRALREDALVRSRDRSIRRQQRMKLWIGDAFELAGEEVLVMARRKHLQEQL